MRRIRLGYNAVPKEAENDIIKVFRSGQYSPGPKVREFEEKFAKFHQSEHAIFVNSGTDALRLGLLALKEKYGWPENSLVAVPALTFPATVNVILQGGLKPLFVDVNMYQFLINPHNLQRKIDCAPGGSIPELKCVMPVHLFGQRCGDGIYGLAKKYKLRVLEDSCESILNKPRGDVSCHSTYMAHHVTTGVGGMALTDDMELNLLIRSFANHGRSASYLPGYFTPRLGRNLLQSRFRFDRVGYSSRATEFEAVLGLSQLKTLRKSLAKRRSVFMDMVLALGEMPDFLTVGALDNACMMFPIVINQYYSKIDKYDLCLYLEKNGIETRDMMPITNQPCYQGIVREDDYEVAKDINRSGFYLPCHEGMTKADVDWIAEKVDKYINKA